MLGALARRLFGSANDRLVKSMRKTVEQINALEPQLAALSDEAAARQDRRVPAAAGAGRDAGRPAGRGLRRRARGRQADAGPAPFRRPADRRHGAAPGRHRRDEDRRGQDPGRHPRRLPQRARRQGRARGHRQRLPGPPRRRLDGRRSTISWAERRRDRAGWTTRSAARPMPATSPTAPTTSSASTICATTCATSSDEMVQRGHHYAIVDEVDCILVDEARTPLIISGPDRRQLRALPRRRQADAPAGRRATGRRTRSSAASA